jgi:hypothetical protein
VAELGGDGVSRPSQRSSRKTKTDPHHNPRRLQHDD